MNVDIKKQGLATSVPNYPQLQDYGIYASTTHNFNFLWQTSKNTEPGTYTVTMTSTVPDTKCDQTTMIPTVNTMNVYVAQSLDGCRAQLQSFAVSSPNYVLNQPVSFTGNRLHEYQDWNYSSISACSVSQATLVQSLNFDAEYNLTIMNATNSKPVYSIKGIFQKATNNNVPIDFSVSWPAAKVGVFTANLKITSIDSGICGSIGNTASSSVSLAIGHDNDNDKVYDIEGDCNDNNRFVFPSNPNLYCDCNTADGKNLVPEICDNIDNNCNGIADDGITIRTGALKVCF